MVDWVTNRNICTVLLYQNEEINMSKAMLVQIPVNEYTKLLGRINMKFVLINHNCGLKEAKMHNRG